MQAPLLDIVSTSALSLDPMIPVSFKDGYSSVIIGGHSSICRWYSEDALHLADNIKVSKERKKKLNYRHTHNFI